MKDSIDRIVKNGNSELLLELTKRVGNATSSEAMTESMNVVAVTTLNKLMTQENKMKAEHVFRIDDVDDLFIVKPDTETITMKSGLCNDPDIVEWKLEVYPGLRKLVVADNCLQFVKGFELRGFKCLEKVEIGMRCFTSSFDGKMEVMDCGVLRSVNLGEGCCVNWSSFTLKNCDSIEEVSIGDGCFVNCANTVFESVSLVIR